MELSWQSIHELEIHEEYPAAIDALEERVRSNPSETEAVIRLGFNLWYAVVEDLRMGKNLPTDSYANRFMELFDQYRASLSDNADFCWVFGQGIQMFWYHFPNAAEELGKSLADRAGKLDDFWAQFFTGGVTQEEIAVRLRGEESSKATTTSNEDLCPLWPI